MGGSGSLVPGGTDDRTLGGCDTHEATERRRHHHAGPTESARNASLVEQNQDLVRQNEKLKEQLDVLKLELLAGRWTPRTNPADDGATQASETVSGPTFDGTLTATMTVEDTNTPTKVESSTLIAHLQSRLATAAARYDDALYSLRSARSVIADLEGTVRTLTTHNNRFRAALSTVGTWKFTAAPPNADTGSPLDV